MKDQREKARAQARIEELSLSELMALRRRSDKQKSLSSVPTLLPQGREGALPLSYAQERLWFLDQLGLVGSAYNMPVALMLEGELDTAALEKSLIELIRRHETLRTRFDSLDGAPIQVIEAPAPFSLEIKDLSTLREDERAREVARLRRDEATRAFDLVNGPLLRLSLLRFGRREHLLLLTIHHIVSDGWSVGVLDRDLRALYVAYCEGRPSSLPPVSIQYADYAIWQRRWLQGERLQDQLRYWRDRLIGAPAQLELPTDRPRPAVESFKGAELKFALPAKLCAGLTELAQREGVTLFMVYLAAYKVLLSRWSGQHDIVVGSPIAGRNDLQLEELVGFFVNTLALRTDVTENVPFRQLLARVKEMTLGAYAHQDLPFEALVKELRPERNLTRQPIFQVMLALQNYPQERTQMPGLTWTWTWTEEVATQFDLILHVYPDADGMLGVFQYATDLFDAATIVRVAGHLRTLLEDIVANPDCPIHQLPLLDEAEKHQLVREWNATASVFPRTELVHALFEQQVMRTPDAIAVEYEAQRLTYAELNARANRLAHYLRDRHVEVGECVPILMSRCLQMLIAQLAILKCGGVYVPIDSNQPQERQGFIMRDCGARLAITEHRAPEGSEQSSMQWINLSEARGEIESRPTNNLDVRIDSPAAAYVMYTSGSTGVPKGVLVPHHAINRLVINNGYAQIEPGDCIAHCSNPAFDASTFEIWGALLNGARVSIVPHSIVLDAERFAEALIEHSVSVLWLTVGLFMQYSSALAPVLGRLRYLITGGDVVDPETIRRMPSHGRPQHLLNAYGPTECTTFSTTYSVPDAAAVPRVLPIGRPIANAQIYILDAYRQPVPIGFTGEIYIGGDGVALGYLNNDELTAERFIVDPFSDDPSARLYKSGDLGRWTVDGNIEFVGRNDQQVKIRGFRIELGEIEQRLLQHPQVTQAVVVAREDVPGEKRLVAYVAGDRNAVATTAGDPPQDQLRDEIVSQWEVLYADTYGDKAQIAGPSFVGWNSSYTGQPIPQAQMEEWQACTIARIESLRPNKVLEIGCGVGLLLQHLAPRCAVYVGTDFSSAAIEHLRQWSRGRSDLEHIELMCRPATELGDLPSGAFDTVVLNSVVQYFPDIDYLLSVLQEAVRVVRPGGSIFIGDVRNLPLLPMFHSAVQVARASASVSVRQLRRRIAQAVAQDKELVIDPQFFAVLPGQLPGVAAATVSLKRGDYDNELTRYRYDVTLQVGEETEAAAELEPIEWQSQIGSLAELEAALAQRRWLAARLCAVPSARLVKEAAAARLIASAEERMDVGTLRRQIGELNVDAVSPEAIWQLAEQHGYEAVVSPGTDHCFDVQLVDRARIDELHRTKLGPRGDVKAWRAYANDPLEAGFKQQLIPALREYLKNTLPEYMVPSAWVVLRQLPITANGKIDRRALPAPQSRPEELGEYVEPKTETERTVAEIWARLLQIDQVGTQDNFFELGGHSLLIVRMLEQLRQTGLSTTVRCVYESPTLAELAARLSSDALPSIDVPENLIPPGCDTITPQMLPLIELDTEHIERIVRAVPGGARNLQDVYSLTPLQEGMLFHHVLSREGGDTYVASALLSLSSRRTLDDFIQGLQQVIDRHDILRTAVLWEELPRPVQVVYRSARLPISELVLDPARDAVEQLTEQMRPELQRLDLRQAPLMHVQIAHDVRDDKWYAVLRLHHLVCDPQSVETMFSEVVACMEGREGALPEPAPYRIHVAQVLAHARTHDATAFFRERLGSIDEPTAPFGLMDVLGEGRQLEEMRQELPSQLGTQVRAQARRFGVSAATLFHAAWALVVSLTSGRDDVVFGTVLMGRLQGSAGAQRILGMFINTLPMRLQLQGTTVSELVEQTQRELMALLDHEHASLAEAQRCSGIVGTAPLFTSMLNYRHRAVDVHSAVASVGDVIASSIGSTNYPITLCVDDMAERFILETQTDCRVDAQRVLTYMSSALQALVEALEQSPQSPVLGLSILPAQERQQVLELFNSTQTPYPQEKLIHELFEEQVRRTPEAIAVVFEDQSLTYRALDQRANQLARYLRSKGVGSECLVALCIERSPEMVVGLLGILKAGGAYVPLDPGYPPERLEYMLKNSASALLLTQQRLKGALLPMAESVIALDADWPQIAQFAEDDRLMPAPVSMSSRQLAYVIYTSGSTGMPKGAMNEHSAVVNRLLWMQRRYGLTGEDRVLQKTPFSFDVSVWEFFWPLICGARLIVARPQGHYDPAYLRQLIDEQGVTTLHFVPSMLGVFLEHHPQGACKTLRNIICSGEELPVTLQNKCLESLPFARLCNLYGPTEAAIDVTEWECRPGFTDTRVPIGRPISNIQMYVLDRHGRPAPIGIAGEIFIGGVGVGRGYVRRPELTAERFVADPFSADPRARLYRTGDVGSWRADGAIEYLGRADAQVKIRGLRIELGEIEQQLLRHSHAKDAVVIARADGSGEKRLVAYLVPAETAGAEQALEVDTLRMQLAAILPEYMIPSAFVILPSLPLSPNGKLDRRALPAPEFGTYGSREYEEPQSETEKILAELWLELLPVERVGRHDNFFELGGHSLLLVKMVERLHRVGLSASVRGLHTSPTLADMASKLQRDPIGHREVPSSRIPPGCEAIQPHMLTLIELSPSEIAQIEHSIPGGASNIEDIYPLSPVQEGILFHHMINEEGADAYLMTLLLSISSKEKLEQFVLALQRVIDRHDALRTAVLWKQLSRAVNVVCRHAPLPVEKIDLDPDRDPVEQLNQRMAAGLSRLDLGRAPLMRLQIAQARDDIQYVIVELHHLVSDHESLDVMFSEVTALLDGQEETLPTPVPFRHHVAHALASAAVHDARAFFTGKLADVDEPTAPFAMVDVYGDASRIEEVSQQLEPALAKRVRARARRLGMSAATLFHAAWALVVAHTTSRDDVVFGTVTLGRGNAGTHRGMGVFINSLPLRMRLKDVTAIQLVEQMQRELGELLDYEHASLAEAQRCSGIAGAAPLFTSLVNYRHSDVDLSSASTRVGEVQLLGGVGRTNYPIMLSVDDWERGFLIEAQTDPRIDGHLVLELLRTAAGSLVDALEATPQISALQLSVLPESERHRLIDELNATKADYPHDRLIHELFEAQAARTPDVIAVRHEGHTLTYAAINRRANQLARLLRDRGVRPDCLVALCADRSLDMVVGLLGILKAGGAYLPLDPNYPIERLHYMLQDAAPQAVLTQRKLRSLLPPEGSNVIELDAEWAAVAPYAADNLSKSEMGLDASHLVYAIYTSGSTGRPKGTGMAHRSMTNLIEWHRRHLPLVAGQQVLQFSSLSFDVAFQEIFSTLCIGGTLVLVDEWLRRDARALLESLRELGIERLFVPPLMLQGLAECAMTSPDLPERLRDVITAGEQLRITPEIAQLFERLGGCRLHNHYGPTETHVVTTLTLPEDQAQWPELPSIGRPVSNTQIYILGAERQLLPVGVVGEIYIGGANVARGYIGRAELTAQRFLDDPFGSDARGRMYKTGDLGRWQKDGTVQYLGRNDNQVKIRGYRIELGEVEARLLHHPQVHEAVVVTREEMTGGRRLIAYVTTRGADAPQVEALRDHLKETLPDHMIPSAIVPIEKLPLTPSGKLDRRALPTPELDAFVARRYEAPSDSVEETIAEIWQSLLRVDRVGRQDNFFDLGGHSLLATRVMARIRELLQVEMPLRAIFDAPTLEQLSARVKTLRHSEAAQEQAAVAALSGNLRLEIDELSDDAVLARIAALEKELGAAEADE